MSVYEASVEHEFTARHAVRLRDGSMEPSHEHCWRVRATFRSAALDLAMGVVIDFLDVQEALKAATANLVGRDLNELAEFSDRPPSAERLAELLAARLRSRLAGAGGRLYSLSVTEAPGCIAAFYPGPAQT